MTSKLIVTIILMTLFSNAHATSCESLWVDNIKEVKDNLKSEISKIYENETLPLVVTPKAIKYARKYQSPGLMIHQMQTMNIASWKIIISVPCDIDKINNLELTNQKAIKNYILSNNKKFKLILSGTTIGAVVEAFSAACSIPIEISRKTNNPTRVWANSIENVSCSDFFTIFAVNGVKISLIDGKLVAEKA